MVCIISEYLYITVLAAAILNFPLPLTMYTNHNRALDIMDPENVWVAVGISLLGVTEPDLH